MPANSRALSPGLTDRGQRERPVRVNECGLRFEISSLEAPSFPRTGLAADGDQAVDAAIPGGEKQLTVAVDSEASYLADVAQLL